MFYFNVVKIFEIGMSDIGWFYFVMEVIEGVLLMVYVDDYRLFV